MQDLLCSLDSHEGYHLREGKLMYKGRLVLSKSSPLISIFLIEFHFSSYRGHSDFFRIYKWLAIVLYWNGMKTYVRRFVAECEIC